MRHRDWRGCGVVHMPRWMQNSTSRWLRGCVSSFNNRHRMLFHISDHYEQDEINEKKVHGSVKGTFTIDTVRCRIFRRRLRVHRDLQPSDTGLMEPNMSLTFLSNRLIHEVYLWPFVLKENAMKLSRKSLGKRIHQNTNSANLFWPIQLWIISVIWNQFGHFPLPNIKSYIWQNLPHKWRYIFILVITSKYHCSWKSSTSDGRLENINLWGSFTVQLTSFLFVCNQLLCKLATFLLVWSNPNHQNSRSVVQWYLTLWWCQTV